MPIININPSLSGKYNIHPIECQGDQPAIGEFNVSLQPGQMFNTLRY
jgi:hypothetical protein